MKFYDLKSYVRSANYRINVSWNYLDEHLDGWSKETRSTCLDMNPEFQRGHVWTEEQQIAFVEFKLKGGEGSDVIYFNCKGWMMNFEGPFVRVDGKQRIEAVKRFMNNEIKVFDEWYYKDFEDPRFLNTISFVFCVNDLEYYEEVLRWYIEMNTGGTVHTNEEIDKVKHGLDTGLSGDLLAIDIRQALYHFGEITGEITNDDLLGNIFANFCIGK